jgi:hypothetical protein
MCRLKAKMERSVSKLVAVTIAVWIGLIMAALIAGAIFTALACAIAWGLVQIFWLARERLRRPKPAEQEEPKIFVSGFDEYRHNLERALLAHKHAMELGLPANDVKAAYQRELFASRRIH